jgi:hypothetical protein
MASTNYKLPMIYSTVRQLVCITAVFCHLQGNTQATLSGIVESTDHLVCREAVILVHAVKVFRADIALLILNVCTKWKGVVNFTSWLV